MKQEDNLEIKSTRIAIVDALKKVPVNNDDHIVIGLIQVLALAISKMPGNHNDNFKWVIKNFCFAINQQFGSDLHVEIAPPNVIKGPWQ